MSENQSSSRGNTKKKWILIAVLAAIAIGAYKYWFSSEAYIQKGNELWDQGKKVEAMRNLVKGYDDFEQFETWMRVRSRNKKELIVDYTKMIELEPKNAKWYCGRADCYREEKNYDAALADYTKAIELEPKNAKWYRRRAGCFGNEKNYDAELADYTKAIEVAPKNAMGYLARAAFYRNRCNYDAALDDYIKAIEVEPQNAERYCERAVFYRSRGNYDAALADYTKAIEVSGKEKNKYYKERGRFYSKMFDREHAMADAKNSAKDEMRLVDVLTDYGNSMPNNDQKYSDEAFFYYTKAMQVYDGMIHHTTSNSHLSDPHLIRGKAYEHLNNYSQAVADYAQVIKNGKIRIKQIEAESAKLSSKVQELIWGGKSKDDALEWVNKDMYAAYKLLGNVYKRNGDWANAIENYTNAIEVNEILASMEYNTAAWDLWKLYACRGECYNGQGDYAKAVSDFTKAIESFPNGKSDNLFLQHDRTWCFLSRGFAYQDWGNPEKATADFAEGYHLPGEEAAMLAARERELLGHEPIYADGI